jgi:hypothetical protein
MEKPGHDTVLQALVARAGAKVSHQLVRREGTLRVSSSPSGRAVLLDGVPVGKTPFSRTKVLAMEHELRVEDERCFHGASEKFEVPKGEERKVTLVLPPREATLRLSAVDEAGAQVAAKAFLVPETPAIPPAVAPKLPFLGPANGEYRVSICSQAVRGEFGAASDERLLHLGEGETRAVDFKLLLGRCGPVRARNQVAGWTTGVAAVLGAGAFGGAVAIQQSLQAGPPRSGLESTASLGHTLNLVGIAGLGLAAVGLSAWLLLPATASACGSAQ